MSIRTLSQMFAIAALGAVMLFPADQCDAGPIFKRFRAKRQAATVQAPRSTPQRVCTDRNGNGRIDPGECSTGGQGARGSGPVTGSVMASDPEVRDYLARNGFHYGGQAAEGAGTLSSAANSQRPVEIAHSGPHRDANGDGVCDGCGKQIGTVSSKVQTQGEANPMSVQQALGTFAQTQERHQQERAKAQAAVEAAAAKQAHALALSQVQAEADRKMQDLSADLQRSELEAKLAEQQSVQSQAIEAAQMQQADLKEAMSMFQKLVNPPSWSQSVEDPGPAGTSAEE